MKNINEAIKFPLTLSQYAKLAFFEEILIPMGVQDIFAEVLCSTIGPFIREKIRRVVFKTRLK